MSRTSPPDDNLDGGYNMWVVFANKWLANTIFWSHKDHENPGKCR